MKRIKTTLLTALILAITVAGYSADQRIQYNESMVGANHPTKSDTLNRLGQVEHNTDGTHKMTSGAAGDLFYHNGTNLTRLGKGADGQVLAQNPGLTAPQWVTRTQQNLLTNSQWSAMSGSTLCEVTSGAAPVQDGANAALTNNKLSNGGFDSVTTGWTAQDSTVASVAGGKTGNCLEITRTANSLQTVYQSVTTVVGKLYQVSAWVKSGSSGDEAYQFYVRNGSAGEFLVTINGTSSGSWVQLTTSVFEATGTTTRIAVLKASSTAGTMLFDSVTLYEVTPGYIAADALAMDGWGKHTSTSLYREYGSANIKGLYGVKFVSGAASQYVSWPVPADSIKEAHYKKYSGRIVTAGMWVLASDATSARIMLSDGVTDTYSAYHTGGGALEWLEVTKTISASNTQLLFEIVQASGKTCYFSQPMLVFGSSIGAGAFQPIVNEWIYFSNNDEVSLSIATTLASGVTAINLEAVSAGIIGKGIKAIKGVLIGKNTAAGKYLLPYGSANNYYFLYSQVANVLNAGNFDIKTDSNGDMSLNAVDANWSGVGIDIIAIQTQ
jgi:hypothetical protein